MKIFLTCRLMIKSFNGSHVSIFWAINELMNWSSHSAKIIANIVSRTLDIMNRLERLLPFSPMKLMYDSLNLSHLQFGITCWSLEWPE